MACAPGQVIRLKLGPGVAPTVPVGRFFDAGDINIMVGHARGEEVRLIISAHVDFELRRDKLRY